MTRHLPPFQAHRQRCYSLIYVAHSWRYPTRLAYLFFFVKCKSQLLRQNRRQLVLLDGVVYVKSERGHLVLESFSLHHLRVLSSQLHCFRLAVGMTIPSLLSKHHTLSLQSLRLQIELEPFSRLLHSSRLLSSLRRVLLHVHLFLLLDRRQRTEEFRPILAWFPLQALHFEIRMQVSRSRRSPLMRPT